MPNYGITPASPYDIEANYEAYVRAATLEIIGEPVRAVARETGIEHNQSRRVGTICGKSIEEFREHARRNKQLIMDLIDQRLPDLVAKLKPMEAFIASGIMADKYRDMTGGAAPSAVHITNIQVNGASRNEAMNILSGAKRATAQPMEAPESFRPSTHGLANAREPSPGSQPMVTVNNEAVETAATPQAHDVQ